ncbi:hypothetical protein DM860_003496 [Cuscuta australis]|uniref:DUF1685 domain-containing protein n=1 Tax=Cuscuta australis TaxID=267555 RepID=A0A328DG82_9ASTE|nr:hypothetical protein DM860_003496 [Cuscuta australis]
MEPKTRAMHNKCRSRTGAEAGPCSSLIKSFSDLEFEELKGFMDLGFDFPEDPADSRLVEIVPGLRKLMKKKNCGSRKENCSRSRPYLSEAWESMNNEKGILKKKKNEWGIPFLRDESDMKASLRQWAFTVASTFR